MKGFGERLKELRKKSNITQAELAEKLNVHLQTISRWERDISEPDMSMYETISKTLSVPLEKLWGVTIPEKVVNGQFNLSQLGKAIYTERKRLKESQDELASVAGVSSDIVSKWERGLICPDIDTLLSLAEHFNVSPSALYYFQLEHEVVETTGPRLQPKLRKPSKKVILIAVFSSILLIALAAVILLICLKPFATSDNETICEHVYRQEETSATCTAQGYITNVCIKCGDTYVSDYTEKLPHTAGDWIIDKEPTCTMAGSKHKECLVCKTHTETASIEKFPHQYGQKKTASTCTEQGYTTYTCTECGSSYKSDYEPVLDHTSGEWVIDRAPTCGFAGSRHKECAVCKTTIETAVIDKLSHSYIDTIVAPEGDNQGYFLYTCELCGDSYKDNYFLPDSFGLQFNFDYGSKTCEVAGIDDVTASKIEIPSIVNGCKVTAIGRRAFADCLSLQEIIIPDSVAEIGIDAFFHCIMLKEAVIPNSVSVLGDGAFSGCKSLVQVELSNKLTSINNNTFYDCINLKSIRVPAKVTFIGDAAFRDCRNLKEVILPEGLQYIDKMAFYICSGLVEIIIPKTVIYIGDNAFGGCDSLTSVVFAQTDSWVADETVIDGKLLADYELAAKYLVLEYNSYIWVRN